MNKEAAPQSEVNQEFSEIIGREFGVEASKNLGETAINHVELFGHQFMSDIIETVSNPKATASGGRTATIDNGQASLDDSSSNDVA